MIGASGFPTASGAGKLTFLMDRPYYVIDAFTGEPMTGNPAAVVLDPRGLNSEQMLQIAAEFNLSETTFILPPEVGTSTDDQGSSTKDMHVRFRWFTPTMEVDMCGHATIAGVHALVEAGRLPNPTSDRSLVVQIETRSGQLTAYVEALSENAVQTMIWLDLVDPVLESVDVSEAQLALCLDIPCGAFDAEMPLVKSQDGDLLLFVVDVAAVNAARPDFKALGEWLTGHGLRGLSLATWHTLTPSIHVQSRFFAPACGVDEDPVTGSVHGPLAAYLAQRGKVSLQDGLGAVIGVQAKAGGRAGMVHALVQRQEQGQYAVRIGGMAVTTMRGTLRV